MQKMTRKQFKNITLTIASIWGWFYVVMFFMGESYSEIAFKPWSLVYGESVGNLGIGGFLFLTPPLLAMLIVPLWFVFYKVYLLIQKRKKAVFKTYVLWQGVWLTIAYVFVILLLVLVRI